MMTLTEKWKMEGKLEAQRKSIFKLISLKFEVISVALAKSIEDLKRL